MTVIVMLDIMKLMDKKLVKHVQSNVKLVLTPILVLNVLLIEKQEVNQNAHAQVNNSQMQTENAKIVTTLVQNVSTPTHVPFVKPQELPKLVFAQLDNTMMDLPQDAQIVYQNVLNVITVTHVQYVKQTELQFHQTAHAQMVNMNSKMNAKIVKSNVILVLT
jgi:hypothetical protein